MVLLLVLLLVATIVDAQEGGGQGGSVPPAGSTTTRTGSFAPTTPPLSAPFTTTGTAPPSSTTTPSSGTCSPVASPPTQINFDFKGILGGSQGGDCNCAKKTACDTCEYGVFGYPCIADACDQCLCGGGLANPPGSSCIPCTENSQCSDGVSNSTCLNGRDGPCEPDMHIVRKALFLGGTFAATDFYIELAYIFQGPLCHYTVNWASSQPVQQVHLFALQYQFGTAQGLDDPDAQCFQGIRYKEVNGANVNYNIFANSLQYDSRFNRNGVSGLVYGIGNLTGNLFFGASSTSPNFRDVTMQCPPGVTEATLPSSFKVVVLGGNIPASGLDNSLTLATGAPNTQNVGTHWILLPDRGVCVGDQNLRDQNDGNGLQFAATPSACRTAAGCPKNPGPPIFANPASQFKRSLLRKGEAMNAELPGMFVGEFGGPKNVQ